MSQQIIDLHIKLFYLFVQVLIFIMFLRFDKDGLLDKCKHFCCIYVLTNI